MAQIKRALLSCFDKKGLDGFAAELAALGVELIASDGTARYLQEQGLAVKTVEQFAGITEQLDGRVKTLHPKLHAGILALRDHPGHMALMDEDALIDLVVVNLYPFEETIRKLDVTLEEALERIDIGGVALLRAAAKNFTHVTAVCHPQQYTMVAKALRDGHGELPAELMQRLAAVTFQATSTYDRWVASYLGSIEEAAEVKTLQEISLRVHLHQRLRYGENPHQQGVWYVPPADQHWGLATMTQVQGKELSYNNLVDVDAAVRCLLDFEAPTCVVIKHNAPCGLASDAEVLQAYERALACDAESAFGGVVGCNRPINGALAKRLTETFLEVIVAPSISSEAAVVLSKKPKLRVVRLEWPTQRPPGHEWRQLLGSWLLQDPNVLTVDPDVLRVVSRRQPTAEEREDLLFAWTAVKHAKSNAIVLAKARATVSIGQGQPSRVGAVRLAAQQAGEGARNAVAASDAFFPFPDGVEHLAQAGVTAVIQPGGSIRDQEVIVAADRANLAMLVTGIRHFRH